MNWTAEETYTGWQVKDGETVIAKEMNAGRDMGENHAKLIAKVPQMIEALKDCKEVFLQLDTRHDGKCYNRGMEMNCECTLCKINRCLP